MVTAKEKLVAAFLAVKRKNANLTQAELANKIGIPQQSLSEFENCKLALPMAQVIDICRVLKIDKLPVMSVAKMCNFCPLLIAVPRSGSGVRQDAGGEEFCALMYPLLNTLKDERGREVSSGECKLTSIETDTKIFEPMEVGIDDPQRGWRAKKGKR